MLRIGIPNSVVASGGIYYWKDNREIPDVLQNVTSVFTKNRADIQRSLLRNVLLNGLQTEYLKSYATMYPRIDTLCMFKLTLLHALFKIF